MLPSPPTHGMASTAANKSEHHQKPPLSEIRFPILERRSPARKGYKSLVRPIYNCSPVVLQPPIGVYIWAFLASVNSPKTFRFRHRSSLRKPAAASLKPAMPVDSTTYRISAENSEALPDVPRHPCSTDLRHFLRSTLSSANRHKSGPGARFHQLVLIERPDLI